MFNAGLVAVPPQIAVHLVIDAERAPELCRIRCAAFVGTCHASRENAQLTEAAKRGDDLLRQPVRKCILPTITGVILEWQDGHRGPTRNGYWQPQSPLRIQDHIAAAGHGTDEVATGIAQKAADLGDALSERILESSVTVTPGQLGGQQFVLGDDASALVAR